MGRGIAPRNRPNAVPAARAASSGGSARLNGFVERLLSVPVATIPRVVSDTGETYPCANADVLRLVEHGILTEGDPSLTPKHFFSRAIFDIAYGDS